MESVELGLDDMFEQRDVDNDDAVNQGMMNNEARDAEDEHDENGDLHSQAVRKVRDMSAGAAKKVVRNPQPKLDATRLNSDRGFPALRQIFEEVKFKGKGHEVPDFLLMMRTLEHWAHRLFPMMTFDEVIERCERLGVKQQVKTVVRKIRMGMPVLDDEFVERQEDSDGEGNQQDRQDAGEEFPDRVDEFEDLLRDAGVVPMDDDEPVRTQAPPSSQAPPTSQATPVSPAKSPVFGKSFSDEQRERMERNKRLAMEKREARLRAQGKGVASIKSPSPVPATPSQAEQSQTQTPSQIATDQSQSVIGPPSTLPSAVTEQCEQSQAESPGKSTAILVDDVCERKSRDLPVNDDLLKELDENSVLPVQEETESVNVHNEQVESPTNESTSPPRPLDDDTNKEGLDSHEKEASQSVVTPVVDDGDRHVTNVMSELSPRIADTVVVDDANDETPLNTVDAEPGLSLCLDPDSSPLRCNVDTEERLPSENESESMEVDTT